MKAGSGAAELIPVFERQKTTAHWDASSTSSPRNAIARLIWRRVCCRWVARGDSESETPPAGEEAIPDMRRWQREVLGRN